MARELGSACKLCRREGQQLFLKGSRCESSKCAVVKRNFQPGMHSWSRGRPSDYGIRLREKQKLKRFFQMTEKQFRLVYSHASRLKGNTGANMLLLLQRRLDHVVNEAGLCSSRKEARQLIAHGHIFVNGHRCDISSANIRVGDTISFTKKEKIRNHVSEQRKVRKGSDAPPWMQVDDAKVEMKIVEYPKREHFGFPVDEQLIVELMSK